MNELMKIFGFFGGIESADGIYSEGDGSIKAVNIVQRYTIDATPRQYQ